MNLCLDRTQQFSTFLDEVRRKIPLELPFSRALYEVFLTQSLTTQFQPIVDLKQKRVIGWEALTRGPVESPLHRPLDLFYAAEQAGVLFELDLLARQCAMRRFGKEVEEGDKRLFINVMVGALATEGHVSGMTHQCLAELGLKPDQVVIELSELHPVADIDQLAKAVDYYQQQGFRVALDDVGAGYNGLRIWSQIRPDLIKIDRYFVSGVDQGTEKRQFLESMVNLAHSFGAEVVAEGVETEEELRIVEQLGVNYVQGYLLGRPSCTPQTHINYTWPEAVLSSLNAQNTAGGLAADHWLTLQPDMRVEEAMQEMLNQSQQDFYPVVDTSGRVHGMIWRRDFMNKLLQRFGYELNSRKPLSELMDDEPIIVHEKAPIETLSRMLTDDAMRVHRDAFIVIRDGRYLGAGTFLDLLRVMTDLKVKSAQYANPLSGLPGNVPIQAEVQRRLDEKKTFSVLYTDLDNFKPFNDTYSYEEGDRVIRMVATLLQAEALPGDFVGHIGGDDFVIISEHPLSEVETLVQRLIQRFAEEAKRFYRAEDVARGGIEAVDRHGEMRFFPLMMLSIGVLHVAPGLITHQQKVSSLVTKAKKAAKRDPRHYVIQRVDEAEAVA